LIVLNKVDLLGGDERTMLELRHRDAVLVSAATGEGVEQLKGRIEAAFRDRLEAVELLVPFESGRVLSELHEVAATSSARTLQKAFACAPACPPGSRRGFGRMT